MNCYHPGATVSVGVILQISQAGSTFFGELFLVSVSRSSGKFPCSCRVREFSAGTNAEQPPQLEGGDLSVSPDVALVLMLVEVEQRRTAQLFTAENGALHWWGRAE